MIEPLLQAERLLIVGLLDEAQQIYSRVAQQDPRNSIAVVGLARVALERGDDETALGHARRALEIDPQNAAALRLEARLREVLATRQPQVAEKAAGQPAAWDSTAPPPNAPPGTAPDAPALPPQPATAAQARPSEQAVFARNPSMADHRRMAQHEVPRDEPTALQDEPPAEPPRRSLLDRLLGRHKGGS